MQPKSGTRYVIKLIVAVGRNGEIGFEGKLPWEGTFIEDQQWYLDNTLSAVRVGCSGSIKTKDDKRAFYIVSARNIVASGSLGIYNWRHMKPHEILMDVQAKHPNTDVFVVGGVRMLATLPFCGDDVFHSHICGRVLRGQGFRSGTINSGLDGRDHGRLHNPVVRLRAHVPRRPGAEVPISIGEVRLRVLRRGRAGLFICDVPAVTTVIILVCKKIRLLWGI